MQEKRIYKAINKKGTIIIGTYEIHSQKKPTLCSKDLSIGNIGQVSRAIWRPAHFEEGQTTRIETCSAKNQHVTTLSDMAQMNVEKFLEYNPHIKKRLIVETEDVRIYLPLEQVEVYIKNSRSNEQDRLSSGRQLTEAELNALGTQKQKVDVSIIKRSLSIQCKTERHGKQ